MASQFGQAVVVVVVMVGGGRAVAGRLFSPWHHSAQKSFFLVYGTGLETHATHSSHASHASHSTHAAATWHLLLIFGDLCDNTLGGGQQGRNARRVHKSRPHHLQGETVNRLNTHPQVRHKGAAESHAN